MNQKLFVLIENCFQSTLCAICETGTGKSRDYSINFEIAYNSKIYRYPKFDHSINKSDNAGAGYTFYPLSSVIRITNLCHAIPWSSAFIFKNGWTTTNRKHSSRNQFNPKATNKRWESFWKFRRWIWDITRQWKGATEYLPAVPSSCEQWFQVWQI